MIPILQIILFWILWLSNIVEGTILPDMTNKTLLLSVAELASNAYHMPDIRNSTTWRNTTEMWYYEYSYGWEVDGLRGHVFRNVVENTIVFSVKGTSLNSKKDKESANMICSCNCCFGNCTGECDEQRLKQGLPNMYFMLLISAYEDAMERYPGYTFWFTGHSMGAVVAALAGVKTCNPVIGFSAPGEQMFADRIELNHDCPSEPFPPIYHVGYYKDPIYVGNCGWLCAVAGYRMDSRCHHGYECTYIDSTEEELLIMQRTETMEDYQRDLGSGLIYTHTINFLIDKVIAPQEEVPSCIAVTNCTEKCYGDSL